MQIRARNACTEEFTAMAKPVCQGVKSDTGFEEPSGLKRRLIARQIVRNMAPGTRKSCNEIRIYASSKFDLFIDATEWSQYTELSLANDLCDKSALLRNAQADESDRSMQSKNEHIV